MTNVYFSKTIDKIIEKMDFSKLGKKVGIKVHFGERGCVTYLKGEIARKVYDKVKSLGKEAALVECNVLYKGSRVNRTEHLATAKEHGFGDMEIDILDGEKGEEFVEIDGCKIGKGIEKYDSLIVLSHFKGHMATGFGGALKNVGMGMGSRAGKLDMHSKVKPVVLDKCISCGKCVEHCNANAISITDGKAHIDDKKCEGCAMCIAVCPTGAMMIPWQGRTNEELQKRVAEYAKSVLNKFPNAIFINVLQNITSECDCMDIAQEPIMEDLGFILSDNIVSADKASLDLVNKISQGKFSKLHRANNDKQIEVAKELCMGDGEYELAEI